MIRAYPSHPYADLFPLRAGRSLIELSDSIAEYGQKEEIVLLQKQVLDGRRRQAAAIRAGITPRYREFGSRPGDGGDPLEFSFAVNYHRRDDMSEAEKVLAAVGYARLKRGDNQHRIRENEVGTKVPSSPPISQKEAAEKFGIGVKQLKRGKTVQEHGVPELVEAMASETVSVSDAAAVAGEPPEVQRRALDAVLSGSANTLREAVHGTISSPYNGLHRICLDLDRIIDRLGQVVTAHVRARDLAWQGLKSARVLIGKL